MRPIGVLGTLLVVAGIVVLALRGVSYTKSEEKVEIGPVEIAAKEKGFITPAAGIVAIAVGALLIYTGRGGRKA